MEHDNPLPSNLRSLREAKGFSREKVAADLNCDPHSLYQWEAGIRMPRKSRLPQLAEYYGVSLEHLFLKKPEISPQKTLPLLGYVTSGGVVRPTNEVVHPPFLHDSFDSALLVEGDDNRAAFADGHILLFKKSDYVSSACLGQMCYVEMASGSLAVRQIHGLGKSGYQIQPPNGGPIVEADLRWACPIKLVIMGKI